MATQAALLADESAYREWLSRALGEDLELKSLSGWDADEVVKQVKALDRAALAFVQFADGRIGERAALVERLVERMPQLPVVALGDGGNSEAVLAAMRAGARDYFVLNRDDHNLSELVAKVLQRSTAAVVRGRARGRVFTVFGGHPGHAGSFLAEHLALAAQEAKPDARVLLFDLGFPPGASLVFLETDQAYTALDAMADVYRCDETLIQTAFAHHASGIYLLSLPEDMVGPPQVNADSLDTLLEVFSSFFDYVIISADGVLGVEVLAAIVARSDRALLVTDQSVLKSRQNKHLLHALRRREQGLDQVGLVVDRYSTRLGLEPKKLAELLDIPHLATLSGKLETRIEAMNAGQSLFEAAPRDAYCDEVRRLTQVLLAGESPAEPVEASEGLLGRLFG